jgi:hypothetical protein
MDSYYGNVNSRGAHPHPSFSRFVAFLDVLGMKEWLKKESPREIAETIDVALRACEPSSCGNWKGRKYGPLIGTTHFSDSLLAWSPDDSWISLVTICTALKMIVGVALGNGVPLRGALSVGEVVCNAKTLRFVGPAIADAYAWAESRDRRYRSVGVELTPSLLKQMQERAIADPVPAYLDCPIGGVPRAVIMREKESSSELMWYGDGLFINHWRHGMFSNADPCALFHARNLPVDSQVERKVVEMKEFFDASRASQTADRDRLAREGRTITSEMIDLEKVYAAHFDLDVMRLGRE